MPGCPCEGNDALLPDPVSEQQAIERGLQDVGVDRSTSRPVENQAAVPQANGCFVSGGLPDRADRQLPASLHPHRRATRATPHPCAIRPAPLVSSPSPIDDCRPQLDWVKANRDAIWARAVEEFFSGVDWDRCDEQECAQECALIAERNEDFTQIDPWAEDIAEQLARRDKQGQVPVQIPDLLKALEVPKDRWSPRPSSRVRQIAESRGWHVVRKQVGGVRVKGLWPPCHTSCHTGATLQEGGRSLGITAFCRWCHRCHT